MKSAFAYFIENYSPFGTAVNTDIFIDAAGAESILDIFIDCGKIESRFVSVAVNNAVILYIVTNNYTSFLSKTSQNNLNSCFYI